MNKGQLFICLCVGLLLAQCGAIKEIQTVTSPPLVGMKGLEQKCMAADTIQSLLISKADAMLLFNGERYEVNVTLYSVKDSILYLSAVGSGYEILRASAVKDSIKVIDRINKIVYRSPLNRAFGYQYPINFRDLQNLVSCYYLCNDLEKARDFPDNPLNFEFDEPLVKKRIAIDRNRLKLDLFEFQHQKTQKYLKGERVEDRIHIYSNFMITEFEIQASGGTLTFNKNVKVKMDVNPRRYTFTELR